MLSASSVTIHKDPLEKCINKVDRILSRENATVGDLNKEHDQSNVSNSKYSAD
jgi:hypothetical protein